MNRRTLLRKLGATGIGAAAISGTATAQRRAVSDLGIDRELDVSSVEGWVAVEALLEPHEIANLPADVDPSRRITIAPEADRITLASCCGICCDRAFKDCGCECCECDFIESCT